MNPDTDKYNEQESWLKNNLAGGLNQSTKKTAETRELTEEEHEKIFVKLAPLLKELINYELEKTERAYNQKDNDELFKIYISGSAYDCQKVLTILQKRFSEEEYEKIVWNLNYKREKYFSELGSRYIASYPNRLDSRK